MIALKTEAKQSVQNKEPGDRIKIDGRILLLFLGLLIIGIIGYFALRNLWIGSIFAHIGGLGIIGLLGSLTGILAKKKGYDYWKVFLLGLILPIFLGVIAVLLTQTYSCGGSVSLAAALFILIIYSFTKRKDANKQTVSQ
jgi:hypothetical protein